MLSKLITNILQADFNEAALQAPDTCCAADSQLGLSTEYQPHDSRDHGSCTKQCAVCLT